MRKHERDARKIIANWGVLSMEVAPRISPIHLLVRRLPRATPRWPRSSTTWTRIDGNA